jgi:hypothetical protein
MSLGRTFFDISIASPRGPQTDQLILDRDRPGQWVSFSAFIGHYWQGDYSVDGNLVYLWEPDDNGDAKVLMRLEDPNGHFMCFATVGDQGKGIILRSGVPPSDKNVTWLITSA